MSIQKQPPQVICKKKDVLKNFANFTLQHTCVGVSLIKFLKNFIKKRLQHRCFPVKFAKFLRAPNLKNICKRLLLFCWRPATLLKRDSNTGVFLWSLQNFLEHLFRRTSASSARRTSMNGCFFPLIYLLMAASFEKLCCTALGKVKTNLFLVVIATLF